MPRRHIKKLVEWAGREDLDLWFEDECHFQQHGSRCVMWVPPEEADPILLHAPTRKSVAVFGAVCAGDGRLVVQNETPFNAVTFLAFLQKLLRHRRPGRCLVAILDNAKYHHSSLLTPWLTEHRKVLQLDFLPPYSPDLNLQERVWKLARRLVTHNRYFPLLDELVKAVLAQFALWRAPNETLHRLCAIT
jgi:transposase